MMSDINKNLEDFISSYEGNAPITLKLVADANGCSVDQVRRRVGGLVKAKKDAFKKPLKKTEVKPRPRGKEVKNNTDLNAVLEKIKIIEMEVKGLRAEVKSKNQSNPWSEKISFCTDKSQLVDIKVGGSIVTGEYGDIHEFYSSFSEVKDLEWNRIDRKHDAGLLSDRCAQMECDAIENRTPNSDEYTHIRISNRQSSQLEKKLNRIIKKIGA